MDTDTIDRPKHMHPRDGPRSRFLATHRSEVRHLLWQSLYVCLFVTLVSHALTIQDIEICLAPSLYVLCVYTYHHTGTQLPLENAGYADRHWQTEQNADKTTDNMTWYQSLLALRSTYMHTPTEQQGH